MDSKTRHPRRLKISQLYEQMKVLDEQTIQVLKAIGREEKEARIACATECTSEDKWTRETHAYSELYCRHCGANKR